MITKTLTTAEIRQRVCRTIEQSRQAAAARREQTAAVEADGTRVLEQVVKPVCMTVVAALKAEGFVFHVLTPAGAVRVSEDTSGESFIEIALDLTRDSPVLIGRVSRVWGRRVLVEEHVVRDGSGIAAVTEEDVLAFLLEALPPFVER